MDRVTAELWAFVRHLDVVPYFQHQLVVAVRTETAREHLRCVCRLAGADPDAAEARARQAFAAEVARSRATPHPPCFTLAEAFENEERLACYGEGRP
jgi:hypothetical protein